MKFQIENDFSKHVKSEELLRVYLLTGDQPFLVNSYREQLVKKAVGSTPGPFNLHRFDGAQLDLQAFYDAVESLPFFAEQRCVTLALDLSKLDAASMKELCGMLENPPMSTTVVLTLGADEGKRDAAPLIKVCDKVGAVVTLGARDRSEMLRFLRNRAQKNGCELSSDCAGYLIERCGDEMQLLATETDKLCAYVGAGTITRAQIEEIVAATLNARVFDLSRAILRGQFTKAMELVDQLCQQREQPGKILAVLAGAFVDLYRGFCVRQSGADLSRALSELGYAKNREFALRNAMSDSDRYTPAQFGAMLRILTEADSRMKSTATIDRVLLEQVLAQLFVVTEGQ